MIGRRQFGQQLAALGAAACVGVPAVAEARQVDDVLGRVWVRRYGRDGSWHVLCVTNVGIRVFSAAFGAQV